MMYLKTMGSEDMPDHDQSKSHVMQQVSDYVLGKDAHGELFITYRLDGQEIQRRVYSNIYVMNADGRTINTIFPPSGSPQ